MEEKKSNCSPTFVTFSATKHHIPTKAAPSFHPSSPQSPVKLPDSHPTLPNKLSNDARGSHQSLYNAAFEATSSSKSLQNGLAHLDHTTSPHPPLSPRPPLSPSPSSSSLTPSSPSRRYSSRVVTTSCPAAVINSAHALPFVTQKGQHFTSETGNPQLSPKPPSLTHRGVSSFPLLARQTKPSQERVESENRSSHDRSGDPPCLASDIDHANIDHTFEMTENEQGRVDELNFILPKIFSTPYSTSFLLQRNNLIHLEVPSMPKKVCYPTLASCVQVMMMTMWGGGLIHPVWWLFLE